jgi:hypothetical protein
VHQFGMKAIIVTALLFVAAAAIAAPTCNTPLLPKPDLNYQGATNGVSGYWDEWIGINNAVSFDNALFAASPNLPACGLNKSASRTWIQVFTDTGTPIQGWCAISSNTQLKKLGFPWKSSAPKPKGIYIRITDRLCNRVVQSAVNYNF